MEWGALVAGIIGIATTTVLIVQYHFATKKHQTEGLLEAFKMLDKEDHREYRKIVFKTYFIYHHLGNIGVFRHDNYRHAIANVMADFDVVGKLVHSDNIDRKQFLEIYGALVYRSWKCLLPHIEKERDERGLPAFMVWFGWLADQGYDYWRYEREYARYDLNNTTLFNPENRDDKLYIRDIPREPAK
jgi:hypothetical protein